jgi:hypothetical protein
MTGLTVAGALVVAAGACGDDSSGTSARVREVDVEDLNGLVLEVMTLDALSDALHPDLLVWSDGRVVVRDTGSEDGLVPARQARVTAEGVDALRERAAAIDPGAGYGVTDVLDGTSTRVTLRTGDEAVSFSVDQFRGADHSDLPGLSSGQVRARQDLQEILDDLVGMLAADDLVVDPWEPYVPDRLELLFTPVPEDRQADGEAEAVAWPLDVPSGAEIQLGQWARREESLPCAVISGEAAATVAGAIDEQGHQLQPWTIEGHPDVDFTVADVAVQLVTSTRSWCVVDDPPASDEVEPTD